MPKAWKYKVIFVLMLALIAVGVVIPTFFAPDDDVPVEEWPSWYSWYSENVYDGVIVRGLDLQGGLHLQYRVDIETAIERKLDGFVIDIPSQLRELGVEVEDRDIVKVDGTTLRLTLPPGDH